MINSGINAVAFYTDDIPVWDGPESFTPLLLFRPPGVLPGSLNCNKNVEGRSGQT